MKDSLTATEMTRGWSSRAWRPLSLSSTSWILDFASGELLLVFDLSKSQHVEQDGWEEDEEDEEADAGPAAG